MVVLKFETPAFFHQMLQFKLQAVNKTKAVCSNQRLSEQPYKIKSEYNLYSIFKTTVIYHFYHKLACESLKHYISNILFLSAYQHGYKLCFSNRKKANFCRVQWIYSLSLSRTKLFAKLISPAVQPQLISKS